MFSTVRPCVRVRACECRFVCPRRNQDFKTTKHPPVPRPSEDLSSVGINILIMLHVLSSVGVFQIRSIHIHIIIRFTRLPRNIILNTRPVHVTPMYLYTHIILLYIVLNEYYHLLCTI